MCLTPLVLPAILASLQCSDVPPEFVQGFVAGCSEMMTLHQQAIQYQISGMDDLDMGQVAQIRQGQRE